MWYAFLICNRELFFSSERPQWLGACIPSKKTRLDRKESYMASRWTKSYANVHKKCTAANLQTSVKYINKLFSAIGHRRSVDHFVKTVANQRASGAWCDSGCINLPSALLTPANFPFSRRKLAENGPSRVRQSFCNNSHLKL